MKQGNKLLEEMKRKFEGKEPPDLSDPKVLNKIGKELAERTRPHREAIDRLRRDSKAQASKKWVGPGRTIR